jgi:hypothetical protein
MSFDQRAYEIESKKPSFNEVDFFYSHKDPVFNKPDLFFIRECAVQEVYVGHPPYNSACYKRDLHCGQAVAMLLLVGLYFLVAKAHMEK